MVERNRKVIVIGAGVVGLTTATLLQEALPNVKVTILAEKFLAETTSNGAAGIFYPGETFRGPSQEMTLKWLQDSFEYYSTFIRSRRGSNEALDAGVVKRKVYSLSTKDPESVDFSKFGGLFEDYRVLPENEIQSIFSNSRYKYGSSFTTVVTDCRKYLPYLMRRVEERGGRIIKRKVETIEQVSGECDLLFNCTGLGAKTLCRDTAMTPIRGQVFKVQAPWIENAIYLDGKTYIIPGTGGMVTLGGTRQFDHTNTDVDAHDAAGIWERCTAVVPSLKDAQVERQWVGLRPYRHEVRVEIEKMIFRNGKTLKVVHNYGHGGYGVMTSPGTSMHAVALGIEALKQEATSKL